MDKATIMACIAELEELKSFYNKGWKRHSEDMGKYEEGSDLRELSEQLSVNAYGSYITVMIGVGRLENLLVKE